MNFRVITTTVFPLITHVRVYDATIDHINDQHPEVPIELPSIYAGLVGAVQNPSYIETGNRDKTYVFVSEESTDAAGNPFRIPVKVIEGTSGLLKTAFFALPENPLPIIWRAR